VEHDGRRNVIEIPDDGEWPCQSDGMESPPPRLVALIYRLLRDEVHPGDLEQVAIQIGEATDKTTYTNPHLEAYARSLVAYLLVGHPTYPYEDGPSTVIGPEAIRSETGGVISYKGEHYERVEGDYPVKKSVKK
jgi:hypothetical protein